MEENLVIVESPAKAKTIERFLGKDFVVKSSFGHIRDLKKKDFGVDIENNFTPMYEVPKDKSKVVSELKKLSKEAKVVWLASDEDREGEAIAWHLYEVLKLDEKKAKRIVFHEITETAIKNAIKNPGSIDFNLVDAQQARRVLDRLVGFELSPVLWKKVKPALSAGRVQSVAVRLIVEREREIENFKGKNYFKVTAEFKAFDDSGKQHRLKADLSKRFSTKEEAEDFLNHCKNAEFKISSVVKKPGKKSPAPPFTTSTLQQEAGRKLGFSVSQTMTVAQKLYEAGRITYMRTDSTNLSGLAINTTKDEIISSYGEAYSKVRQFATKAKGAQEAHEAIRPTYISNETVPGTNSEKRLYDLIRKRTLACQMSDAKLEKTNIIIDIAGREETFNASGEVIVFDGFLKVYMESTDDEQDDTPKGILPPLKEGALLEREIISATQRFENHPPRYTEPGLVKKMEELGIGRPSTYAPTISTIQKREYIIKEEREGKERNYHYLVLSGADLKKELKTEITGYEKNKLFPTDIGMVVNDFLVEHFKRIMDYKFTAEIEKQFDEIAMGKVVWQEMLGKFYKQFHDNVEHTLEHSEKSKGEKLLGTDPKTGKPVYVKIGRYGPMAQIGETTDEEKPQFAGLLKHQHLNTITLEEALELFKLPRKVDIAGVESTVAIGRFGPYVRYNNKFYSINQKIDDPLTVSVDRLKEIIKDKDEKDKNKFIKTFDEEPELQVLNGRWGPYLKYKKKNFKLPKDKKENPEQLSLKECMDIVNGTAEPEKKTKAKPKAKKKK